MGDLKMTIEVGSTIFGKDEKQIKIIITNNRNTSSIITNNQEVRAYIDTCGNEVGLDVFSLASVIEVLFGSLNPKQKENLIKKLVGKNG